MKTFAEIYDRAVRRHGEDGVQDRLVRPKSARAVAATPDDRWLAGATRAVFNAGFNWKVIDAKWDGFEAAFHGFDLGRCSMLTDDDIATLMRDARIVRNGQKISSVGVNARFFADFAKEHGGVGRGVAKWPAEDFAGLLELLKSRGSRLGGATAQYFLRHMGVDGFVLSKDVAAALVDAGAVDKPPSSKKAMAAVQGAFNQWREESGRSLTEISRVLALSIDG